MTDPRTTQLAKALVRHSCHIQPGEHVLLDLYDAPEEIGIELIRAVREADGIPHVQEHSSRLVREMLSGATDAQYESISALALEEMKAMDAYIAIRGSRNTFENSGINPENMKLAMKHMRPVHNQRVCKTKWCVLRWPTPSMAQGAGMSTEDFEDFYFRCCLADYEALNKAMLKLADRMKIGRAHV